MNDDLGEDIYRWQLKKRTARSECQGHDITVGRCPVCDKDCRRNGYCGQSIKRVCVVKMHE